MVANNKAILFDLGDTLMVHVHPWTNVLVRAGMEMESFAIDKNWLAPETQLARKFLDGLKTYYQQRDQDLSEGTTLSLLRKTLTQAQTNLSDRQTIEMLGVFYAKTRENWQADPAADEVLKALVLNGYELGILSNAADHDDVLKLVQKFGFDRYIQKITTSAQIGKRKPHPHAFASAIERFNWVGKEIIMVGDRYAADIQGANEFGLPAIWINRTNDDLICADDRNKIISDLKELSSIL